MKQNSTTRQLGWYDIYAGFRELVMLVVASLIVNVNGIENFLINVNCPEMLATTILFVVAEIGRRFFKNYSPKT